MKTANRRKLFATLWCVTGSRANELTALSLMSANVSLANPADAPHQILFDQPRAARDRKIVAGCGSRMIGVDDAGIRAIGDGIERIAAVKTRP